MKRRSRPWDTRSIFDGIAASFFEHHDAEKLIALSLSGGCALLSYPQAPETL